MSSGMVTCNRTSALSINYCFNLIAKLKLITLDDFTIVEENAVISLCGVLNLKSKSVTSDNTCITNLSAAFCIKCSFICLMV